METTSSRTTGKETLVKLAGIQPGLTFGAIILIALIAFELFNYSTTDYALRDLLGDMKFAGLPWSTVLTIAFCGIDFAGLARLFTPEQDNDEPKEVWYLFGAWLLAATMNAILTWWGVSMAVSNHAVKSTAVVDANTIIKAVPIFVAIMVWVIRILIIGSLSVAADKIIWGKHPQKAPAGQTNSQSIPGYRPPSPLAPTPRFTAPRPGVQRPSAMNDETSANPPKRF